MYFWGGVALVIIIENGNNFEEFFLKEKNSRLKKMFFGWLNDKCVQT